jgi:hypothetical protein
MSTPHHTNTGSDFERLPPELKNAVLGQLVGLGCPLPEPQLLDEAATPALTVCNKPKFSTAILRTSKELHAISKSYMDIEN